MEKHNGFIKTATCVFDIKIGNIAVNFDSIAKAVVRAAKDGVELLVFPELCLTGYTCQDWFLRKSFIDEAMHALETLAFLEESGRSLIFVVGAPVLNNGNLYNCAVVYNNHKILAAIPKTYLPNYGEYYEWRWFASSLDEADRDVTIGRHKVPFGTDIIIESGDLRLGCEICEDLWTPVPPSSIHTLNGANVIACPSASNDIATKKAYRKSLVEVQSAKCNCGYIYASAGSGESTTDVVYGGHQIIASCGTVISETESPFLKDQNEIRIHTGIIDLEKIINDQMKVNSSVHNGFRKEYRIIPAESFNMKNILPDYVNPYPFIPAKKSARAERCMEVMRLQAAGLATRMRKTGLKKTVIGISGGLDSTLALLVIREAHKMLGYGMDQCICVTMPGFGTTKETKNSADTLMKLMHTDARTIGITSVCSLHLLDIGHKEGVYDVTYENAQARERTQILMDLANMENGLVVGTGDMSELALGWATYNGDHMSMYGVNASVPKTLVKFMIETYAEMPENEEFKDVLLKICSTTISPELLPPDEDGNRQSTEQTIGKYDLHDFFLYNYLRNGYDPDKMYDLAKIAFKNVGEEEIKNTLRTFVQRFENSQFKRSCLPDGPKVGTVSLSPRGDLRLPSDMDAAELSLLHIK